MNLDTSTRPLAARLGYLSLASSKPDALAAFYEKVMGMRIEQDGDDLIATASERRLVFAAGPDNSLASSGFFVESERDLDGLADRLNQAGWMFERQRHGSAFLESGAIVLRDPDGNQLLFGIEGGNASAPGPDADDSLPARLQHVVVASRDAARMSSFYQEVLGFILSDDVVHEDGSLSTAFLRCGREHHNFAVFQASSNRLDHHCYEAGEWNHIRDWGDRFARNGVKVEWGPGRHGPGNNLFLFVHDPGGNWLEISAELEIVSPDRVAGVWPHEQRTLNSWGSAPLRS